MANDSFPFNIYDVARLCGILVPVSNTKRKSVDIDCPFCGKRKKMNLNSEKNQFRCNICNEGGHMIRLYKLLTGYNGSNGETVKEIKANLGIEVNYVTNKQLDAADSKTTLCEELTVDFEKMKKWDTVYRAFLNKLSLGSIHKKKLLNERFMSEEEIERYCFRSVPLFGYKRICQQLIDEGIQLEGVGGFYYDAEEKSWSVALNPKITGYIIPVWNFFGKIQGLQVRLDKPFGKCKYHLVSSDDYFKGAKTPAVPFFVRGNRRNNQLSKTLFVTEGFFKAAIPSKLYDYNIMALFGVNNQKEFARLVPYIKEEGYTNIVEAFDADFVENPHVKKAKANFKALILKNGFSYSSFEWDIEKGKGLDDFALYQYNRAKK